MGNEWHVAAKTNGVTLYVDDTADLRHLANDVRKAHVFTTKPIADSVARMLNEVIMDAMLSGHAVPNIRFKVYRKKGE